MKWLALVVPAVLAVDLSSMLQVEVASSAEFGMAIDNIESQIANLNIPGQTNRMAIGALMKSLGKSDRRLDDDSKNVLNQVIEVLENSSGVFETSRAGWQTEMDESITTTTNCNVQWTHHVDNLEGSFTDAETVMNTCRLAQQSLVESRDDACEDALNHGRDQRPTCQFQQNIPTRHTNGTIDVAATKIAMDLVKQQLSAAAVFFATKVANVSPKFELCKSLVNEEVAKKQDCDAEQINADSHYCMWQHANREMCSARTQCIADAVIVHDDEWARLNALARTSAKEACYIKHVICLVRELVVNASTDPDVCNHEGFLDNWEVRCSEYLLNEPASPVADACDLSQVAHDVGSAEYFAMHYTNHSTYSARVEDSAPCPTLPDLSTDDQFP